MTNLYQLLFESQQRRATEIRLRPNAPTSILVAGQAQPLSPQPLSSEAIESLAKKLLTTADWATLQSARSLTTAKWFRSGELHLALAYTTDGLHLTITPAQVPAKI